jgi:purine nucleosidase
VHGEDGFGDTGCFASSRLPEEEHAAHAAISRKARAFNRARGRPGAIAADALAMAVALDPAIVTASGTHHVAVETGGEHARGATVVDWEDRLGQPPNARIVLSADAECFERRVAQAFGAAGRMTGTGRPV